MQATGGHGSRQACAAAAACPQVASALHCADMHWGTHESVKLPQDTFHTHDNMLAWGCNAPGSAVAFISVPPAPQLTVTLSLNSTFCSTSSL